MAVLIRIVQFHFLVSFSTFLFLSSLVTGVEEYVRTCEGRVDLQRYDQIKSGILKVSLPENFVSYQNDPTSSIQRHCDIMIMFSSGQHLQIELYYLDIIPGDNNRRQCNTGLKVFEQFTGKDVYGGRLCMEAWEWEERHRKSKQEKKVVKNSPLTFRLVSEGPYRGKGFKVHFNEFTPEGVCQGSRNRYFKCESLQRCVHEDLTCDGWDDCGDDSDEDEDAGCGLLTATEIVGIITGILLVLGSIACVAVFFVTYRRRKMIYGLRSDSKVPINHWEIKASADPIVVFNHSRYNSQESMNKSGITRLSHQRRDSDSDSVNKEDLEKLERLSVRSPDTVSERSYRSRRSQGKIATAPPEPVKIMGRYNIRSQSSLGDRDERESRDRRSRDRDRASSRDRYSDADRFSDRGSPERERDRDRYRNRDNKAYDSDEDRGYRRRHDSRDRNYRQDDRSSDDSDYERERRRRRRSKERYSRDRYDDQDDYDSDRERYSERPRRRRDYDSDRERSREHHHDRFRDEDSDRPSRRRGSRERDRDYDRYNDDEESDRPYRSRGQSRERDRDRDTDRNYEENPYRRRQHSRDRERRKDIDDEDGLRGRRPLSKERELDQQPSYEERDRPYRRRGPSAEREKRPDLRDEDNERHNRYDSHNAERERGSYGNRRSRSKDNVRREEEYDTPPTPPRSRDLKQPTESEPQQNRWRPSNTRRRQSREKESPPNIPSAEYEDVFPAVPPQPKFGYKEESV